MNFDVIITQIQLNLGITADGIAGPTTWKTIYKAIIGQPATTTNLLEMIKSVQAHLGVAVDGNPGTNTWNAINNSIIPVVENTGTIPISLAKVDDRSEGVISKLLPNVQPLARQLVINAAAAGITIKIISGLRTYEEQDALYAQGRTTPGNIVTNARGGQSNHNFGLAFDIGVFENGKYMGESPSYATVGPIGVALGLSWGGNWVSIKDKPHYELRPTWAKTMSEGAMLAALRTRKEQGEALFA